MENFLHKIGVAFLGESAMRSWDEIDEKKFLLKSQLSHEQNQEIMRRLDFHETELLEQIVLTELSPAVLAACTATGMLAAVCAKILDCNGEKIEAFINGLSIEDLSGNKTTIGKFDTNNIFDIKRGANHREQLFHSGNLFMKAPADFIKPDGISIGDMMGGEKSKYSLIEMLIKHYGLSDSGILNIVSSVIKIHFIHFVKDIFTPAGLPLPFSDIFTKFIKSDSNVCGYRTYNWFYDAWLKEVNKELRLLHIRASDINSLILIKIFNRAYVRVCFSHCSPAEQKSIKRKMNVATSGTLMVSQLLILASERTGNSKIVDGGKINSLIAKEWIEDCIATLCEVCKNHNTIMDIYAKRRAVVKEVIGGG